MTVEPVATYRFPLSQEFGFTEVIGRLAHVQRLGATHIALSLVAQAAPGSPERVVDHTAVGAELGGEEGFERLLDAAAGRNMGVLFDHDPGSISIARPELSRPWWELLRDGRSAQAADWFDVDWSAAEGKVVLPILDRPPDVAVAAGSIAVDGDEFTVGNVRLPLADGDRSRPLAELIMDQHYLLVERCDARRNVRRYRIDDDRVAVRVDMDHVAEAVDTIPARFASHPGCAGVQVRGVDALIDPLAYLRGLRDRVGDRSLIRVEKILTPGEWLPEGWPVDGTTGYDFIRSVDHVMLAAGAEPVFNRRWADNAGGALSFHDIEVAARHELIDRELAPDFERLVRIAERVCAPADHDALAAELRTLTVGLSRHRTHLPDDAEAVRWIATLSAGPVARALTAPGDAEQVELCRRWQSFAHTVVATAQEDRAFHRHLRLAALCEVGGAPDTFAVEPERFHADNLLRHRRSPYSSLAGSTAETRRSEDVRAQAAASTWRVVDRRFLLPHGRLATSDHWADWSRAWAEDVVARADLDPTTVSLVLQTVVSAPGLSPERLGAFLVRSARARAVHTSSAAPDADYERRLAEVADLAIEEERVSALGLEAISPGISLAATVLRLTAPGVPEVYHGAEAFSFRLTAPDSRTRPDEEELERFAQDDRTVDDLWSLDDPAIKTVLIRSLLDLRRRRPETFGPRGSYTPIDVEPGAIAFVRGDDVVVTVRCGLADISGRFEFPPGAWYDLLDPGAPTLSGRVEMASLVGSGADLTMPVAVFERD